MLWFGLRARVGKVARALRILQERLERLEQVADPVRLRAVALEATAALDAAQNKINSVVERRRKQIAYDMRELDDYDDDDTDDQIRELMGQRRGVTLPDAEADDAEEENDEQVQPDGR